MALRCQHRPERNCPFARAALFIRRGPSRDRLTHLAGKTDNDIELVVSANLPTAFGTFRITGFSDHVSGKEHVALVMGDVTTDEPVLLRIHSECLTGDTLFSLKCDCGFQLESALAAISKEKRGVLLYVRQEGRCIGLINKRRAYALQDKGLDTYDANVELGFKPDERNYGICASMIRLLGIKSVKLMTNNPDKINQLEDLGITVAARVPLEAGLNRYNKSYLETKLHRFKHMLTEVE